VPLREQQRFWNLLGAQMLAMQLGARSRRIRKA
jgi:hypothetical protein